jgi:hypothetical protein
LWKYGKDYWYDKSKDKLIHISFVDSYIDNINTWKKSMAIKKNQEKKLLKRIDSWD